MPYMPLDVNRMFNSDFYVLSSGDEFKAGLSLWGKAFLQMPAGSLPDDDRLLAHLSGAGTAWKRVKEVALRGWIKCSDGRLYHRTVAEKAIEAWKARLERRARTEAARAARLAARADSGTEPPPSVTEPVTHPVTDNVTPIATRVATTSVTDTVTGSKGTEGKGTEGKIRKKEEETPPTPPSRGACSADAEREFDGFWDAYPRKVGKGAARRAYAVARKKADPGLILGALAGAVFSGEARYIPHPATWLNQERWEDEPTELFDPVLRAVGLSPEDLETMPFQGLLQ
jgi:hypothetical protein